MTFSDDQKETRRRSLTEGLSPQEQVEANTREERQQEEERKAFNDYVSGVMTEIGRAYEAGASSYIFSLGPEWDKGRWKRLQANYPHGHTVIDLAKVAQVVTEHMKLEENGYSCTRAGSSYEIRF